MQTLVNLTPHPLVFYESDKTTVICTIPSSGICRLAEEKAEPLTVFNHEGKLITVKSPPKYGNMTNLSSSTQPICVSMVIGQYLANNPSLYEGDVYGVDSGPDGVVRGPKGEIIGSIALIKYK